MKVFHCDHCGQLVFFENTHCGRCNNLLAFLPDLEVLGSLHTFDDSRWQSPLPRADPRGYRLCRNYVEHQVCNWAIPDADPHGYCLSCRLTSMIPNLRWQGNKDAWHKLEAAKRRLVYSLLHLRCPIESKHDASERGLEFQFLADDVTQVMTGHSNGLITINIAEADEVERERRRVRLHEPYRTLLGHMRHEVGHYFWDRLVDGSDRLDRFRQLFGDERLDYAQALQKHYAQGSPADWQSRFVSSYASCHPWEDWAETWAHYLHMTDALEMARACGVSMRPPRPDEPSLSRLGVHREGSFEALIKIGFR